ncbi:hypothetical protein [Falsiroseomonas sp. E2-1-a4]|uniref:hypothetical protein n=1 Tax=Falsiroseomonas sp. E2-1-a4 TaxID=3239299 RepID=UPI003F3FA9FA
MPELLAVAAASPKRSYARLTPEQWGEARAAWATGAVTAEELARHYGCSLRSVQLHMAQHRVEKGSAAAALTATVEARVLAEALPGEDDLATRIRQTRDGTYADAEVIQRLVMRNVQLAQDPATGFAAVAALRALDLAAAALGRTQRVRWLALGLDKALPAGGELPELVIREMTAEETAAIRDQQLREDAEADATQPAAEGEDDDDVVIEGEDDAADQLAVVASGPATVLTPAAFLNDAGQVGGCD